MTPRIENISSKLLVGKRMQMSLVDFRPGELWRSFMPFRQHISHSVTKDLFSLSVYPIGYFEHFNPGRLFEKWVAVEVSKVEQLPDGLESFTLPGGTYAVFAYKGLSSDPRVFEFIYQSWLPSSRFMLDYRPHFEVLGSAYQNNNPLSEEEIWIPVKAKNEEVNPV